MPPDPASSPDPDGRFRIEFHRCLDGLVYAYEPAGERQGRPCWRRIDLPLDLLWHDRWGWIGADPQGRITARPWEVAKEDQGALPPAGIWVSRKGVKSYVYLLKHIRD